VHYGPDNADLLRPAADIDRILTGAKPADLSVEPPTKFQLILNLGTAKTLRRTIPPSMPARADETIQWLAPGAGGLVGSG
jgi:putative ABC transport system substrate-binding protein